MVPISCRETSVSHYHYSPRNKPKEHSFQLLRCGSLKPHVNCRSRAVLRDVFLAFDNTKHFYIVESYKCDKNSTKGTYCYVAVVTLVTWTRQNVTLEVLAYLVVSAVVVNATFIRGVADKSLARHISRCRRTESIVSLEREVCSCAELQVFSCYRDWKEACQATRAVIKFFFFPPRPCKARRQRKFTPFWQKYWGNMHHHIPPSKTGWPILYVSIFPPVMRLILDNPKQWPPWRLLIKFTS